MKIALDIDGTITENYKFFSQLTNKLKAEFVIVTGRGKEYKEETIQELEENNIKFSKIYFVDPCDWEAKGKLCEKLKIDIFFEDMDEFIRPVPKNTLVFKVRNGGNYDFKDNNWLI